MTHKLVKISLFIALALYSYFTYLTFKNSVNPSADGIYFLFLLIPGLILLYILFAIVTHFFFYNKFKNEIIAIEQKGQGWATWKNNSRRKNIIKSIILVTDIIYIAFTVFFQGAALTFGYFLITDSPEYGFLFFALLGAVLCSLAPLYKTIYKTIFWIYRTLKRNITDNN